MIKNNASRNTPLFSIRARHFALPTINLSWLVFSWPVFLICLVYFGVIDNVPAIYVACVCLALGVLNDAGLDWITGITIGLCEDGILYKEFSHVRLYKMYEVSKLLQVVNDRKEEEIHFFLTFCDGKTIEIRPESEAARRIGNEILCRWRHTVSPIGEFQARRIPVYRVWYQRYVKLQIPRKHSGSFITLQK